MNKLKLVAALLSLGVGTAFAACSTSAIESNTPTENFTIDEANGVVTDHTTGLMWPRCVEGFTGSDCRSGDTLQVTFDAAITYIDDLNNGAGFAGYNDWRLPNVKELRSIVDEHCTRPALNEEVFPLKNTDAADDQGLINNMVLLTSTPTSYYDSQEAYVWAVDFATGQLDRTSIAEYNYVRFFRMVRDAR